MINDIKRGGYKKQRNNMEQDESETAVAFGTCQLVGNCEMISNNIEKI